MKFFVDFENVNSRGFLGAEFLLPEDEVLLFYSKCCKTLERDVLDKLYASGCAFSLCRLERTGRNALDFYITSNIGEVLGRGYSGIIAIVSHDRGFQAIYDYWKTRNPEMSIVSRPDIAHCIIASNEQSLRRKQVCRKFGPPNIETEYKRFQKRDRILRALTGLLDSSEREWEISSLAENLMQIKPGRESYLSLMREYGIRDGQAIYRVLKNVG